MDFVKIIEEIYKLEYITSQLEKGQEKRAKTRGRGFKADMWLQNAKPRLESLLDQMINLLRPTVESHWLGDEDPSEEQTLQEIQMQVDEEVDEILNDLFVNNKIHYRFNKLIRKGLVPGDISKLKNVELSKLKKILTNSLFKEAEFENRVWSKTPKLISWIKKQNPKSIKEKIVLFHALLNIVHERGKISDAIFIEFVDDHEQHHDLIKKLDKLSAGPKPEWDSFIERMLLSESTLQKYINMILN